MGRRARIGEARVVVLTVIFLPVTVACRILFGPWEVRHLLTTLPLLMLCLWDGVEWLLSKIRRYRSVALCCDPCGSGGACGSGVSMMPPKVHLGIDVVVRDLLSMPQYANDRFLIVSDAVGEGVFIAEVAAHEKRPGHVIERGSKVLAEESFMGESVRPYFTTPEELMSFFEKNAGPGRDCGWNRSRRAVHESGARDDSPESEPLAASGHIFAGGAPLPLEVLRLEKG